jgi:hypothetical protein
MTETEKYGWFHVAVGFASACVMIGTRADLGPIMLGGLCGMALCVGFRLWHGSWRIQDIPDSGKGEQP